MNFGLSESIVLSIIETIKNFPQIEKVIIYGSRAKGNYKNGSDIDLTLIGNEVNLKISNKLEIALDDLLLPYTFDISIYHHITNKELISHINRVGIVFFEKQSENNLLKNPKN